jgi:hypothetical protein
MTSKIENNLNKRSFCKFLEVNMSLRSKINFRRILVVFLVQITLFLGLAFGSGHNDQVLATVLNRQPDDAATEKPVDDATYEELKAKRSEAQAQRSKLASQKNNSDDENISEKLNLDESVPNSTKKFFKQIQGKEPIIDKTEPANKKAYITPRQK